MVMESKLLVTIKKGGNKVCGSFTRSSAPSSEFNLPTKVWSGKKENVAAAQKSLLERAQANSLASLGKYAGGVGGDSANASSYVKGYTY